MKRIFIILGAALSICACAPKEYDVCIYGGTASGIVAAKAAAQMGLRVMVVEPTSQLGGMTTGGLGQTDIGNKQVVNGLALKFYRELGKHYGTLENWTFEPSAASAIIKEYATSPRIKTLCGYHLVSAVKEGTRIMSFTAANGTDTLTFSGKWFIDASYEGDLMAKAGVSYRTGREDNSEYGETWNGSQLFSGHPSFSNHQFPDGVDPYVIPGDPDSGLLWGISNQQLNADGTGDNLIQAYNYRICLTCDPENRIPIEQPENYDPSKYELLVRLYDAQPNKRNLNNYFIWSRMPNNKTDVNNRGGFSTDMIGMNYNYPEGTWEERQQILKAHKDYTLGLLYFTANDQRIPEEIRNSIKEWGLPKDEYVDNGNWTPQLYIRECRRLVGEYVATQADCDNKKIAPEGVAYAAYTMDSHNTQRVLIEKNGKTMVTNEGNAEIHGGLPYPISYRSITPKREECTNLLVPVCMSASHIAYGSIRMEPVFMCLGQAAGIACGLSKKEGLEKVQDVDYKEIVDIFEKDPYMDGSTPDIILDDKDATVTGEWETIISTRGWGASSYKGISEEGSVVFEGTAAVAGEYKVYNYTHFTKFERHNLNISLNPITEFDFSDGQHIVYDAAKADLSMLGQTSSAWQPIGIIKLGAGEKFSVTINGGEKVVADAILLVKE